MKGRIEVSMNEPLISVIVPVYNVEQYLDRCISSIVGQTYKNLEIILVDDGSMDRSPRICDDWAEKDSRIRVIHKDNGGSSSARNAGLDVCKGGYVTFVDSDDWIELDYYKKVIMNILLHRVQIVCVGRYDVDSDTLVRKLGLCPADEAILTSQELLQRMLTWRECDFSSCDKVFSVSLWDGIRFPIGKTSEDVGILYRVVAQAEQVFMLPEPMYNYYHRKGSTTAVNLASRNTHIVEFADEICAYAQQNLPRILPEAEFFKFKTLLYWNREFMVQPKVSNNEIKLNHDSRVWFLKRISYVMLRCPYIGWKDKLWYVFIVLKMKHIVQWLVLRKRK